MDEINRISDDLISRYKVLSVCRNDIEGAFNLLKSCFENDRKVLICGNGGSASDSSHIVGELMKGFMNKRRLSDVMKSKLEDADLVRGKFLGENLQGSLPAIALNSHTSLTSAVANDMNCNLIYAQQVLGYGREGDVLIGISTSGNAENVINAAVTAKASGLYVIGMTGETGGALLEFCDVCIRVPSAIVPHIQELHLPVYHTLCAMIEEYFFND